LQEEIWEVFDQGTNKTEANLLPLASNAWTEGLDNVEGSLSNDKRKTAPAEGRLADPKRCHRIAANFEDDEKRGTHVVAGRLDFQNDRHLEAVGLQISAATCNKERLNSLKAFDEDTLTGFGIILNPQTMSTSKLNLVAIANPREIVCYSLEEDAALSAMIIIFVSIENLKMKKKRPRRRKKERRMNQDREGWNWMRSHGYLLQVFGDKNSLKDGEIVMTL